MHIVIILFSLLLLPRPPTSTLFPYTTLFRSLKQQSLLRLTQLEKDVVTDVDNAVKIVDATFSQVTATRDRKSTRLNSSHLGISYAVFCLKKKKNKTTTSMYQ